MALAAKSIVMILALLAGPHEPNAVQALPSTTSAASDQDKDEKRDAKASAAVEQFLRSLRAKDLDSLMKVLDVPFFLDGRKIVTDRAELRKEFSELLADKDFSKLVWKIKEVKTHEEMKGKLAKKDAQMLKDIVQNDDLVVHVILNERDGALLFVRFRAGRVQIVGLRD